MIEVFMGGMLFGVVVFAAGLGVGCLIWGKS